MAAAHTAPAQDSCSFSVHGTEKEQLERLEGPGGGGLRSDRTEAAKGAYRAYQTGERAILDDLLAADFVFHSLANFEYRGLLRLGPRLI